MRRILTGFVMATVMAAIPTLALGGNQEIAEQIAQNLRQSGQMSDYKIGVKYQNGTAWLRGRVQDEAQMKTAIKVAFKAPGVKRIVNELSVASDEAASTAKGQSVRNPLRGRDATASAERVPSSYTAQAAERTSMQESPDMLPERMAAPSASGRCRRVAWRCRPACDARRPPAGRRCPCIPRQPTLARWLPHDTTSPACQTMRGQAMRLTQIMPA